LIFIRNGLDGSKCLLRAICESADASFLSSSGVLGHLLHIILRFVEDKGRIENKSTVPIIDLPNASSPSTSMDEDLPSEYSKAEKLGSMQKCQKYRNRCGVSILSLISKLL
jgi:hypothetical protein